MKTESVDAAEKEASEVLHSLLSVERIEKPIKHSHKPMQQVLINNRQSEESAQITSDELHWNNSLPDTAYNISPLVHQKNYQSVDWKGSLGLDVHQSLTQDQSVQSSDNAEINSQHDFELVKNNNTSSDKSQKTAKPIKKSVRKRYKKDVPSQKDEQSSDSINVEDSAHEVRVRFQLGCECQDDGCFRGLNPENVYKHRLNIAELTKEEHDMYLMGVTMACMADPGVTAKQRKRRRLRAQYVYQGRRVCLSAFLYLENCTLYQLKRIRKHVMTHGVAPRVHGNHGKKPHNVFPLDTYRRATEFLKSYIEKYNTGSSNLKSPILFPAEISRKTIHNLYKQMVIETGPPEQKLMGYSTFRHFMKEQFPQVRFCKQEPGLVNSSASGNTSMKSTHNCVNNNNNNNGSSTGINNVITQLNQPVQPQPAPGPMPPSHHQHHNQPDHIIPSCITNNHDQNAGIDENHVLAQSTSSSCSTSNPLSHSTCPVSVPGNSVLSSAQMTTIPVILSEPSKPDMAQQQTAFIVTPVSQLVQPFQTGHTITVTPITNTAYAFATF